jgi:Tfp pilus assembly protein PilV
MKDRRSGFTIVEVLIAVIMLTIGILALASSVGGITRMMSGGQRKTRSYALVSSTMDSLRNEAKRNCGGMVDGTRTETGGFTRAWRVGNSGTTSTNHVIRVITAYQVGVRTQGDTLFSTIYC